MIRTWQQNVRGGVKPGYYDAELRPCTKGNGVYYFQSKGDLECARGLELQRKAGLILKWEYQPAAWDFLKRADKILRAHTQYRPDFIVYTDRKTYWIEVKGYLNARGRTVLKRAVKYYPEHELWVYSGDERLLAPRYLEREDMMAKHKRETKKLRSKLCQK